MIRVSSWKYQALREQFLRHCGCLFGVISFKTGGQDGVIVLPRTGLGGDSPSSSFL